MHLPKPLPTLSLFLALATSCAGPATDSGQTTAPAAPRPDPTCDGLFGAPGDNTGLDEDRCQPTIAGASATWTPTPWDAAALDALRGWQLVDPPSVPTSDPYAADPPPEGATKGSVCALHIEDAENRSYRLDTWSSVAAAESAGARVTHGGGCGLCSSLQDLAVYAGIPDLTDPVRQCGLEGVLGDFEDTVVCLEELGFTAPCARIWAYNARHTQDDCFDTCVSLLDAPYHQSDGSFNECLACDEELSGPVFKAVAGRTRRNSGLATAICRPCETVWRVDHGGLAR